MLTNVIVGRHANVDLDAKKSHACSSGDGGKALLRQ